MSAGVCDRSSEHTRYRVDRLHARAKPRHALAVSLEVAVGQLAHAKIGDPAERGPRELGADIGLAFVARHQKEVRHRRIGGAKREGEHAYNARVERRRVLFLEGPGDAARRSVGRV